MFWLGYAQKFKKVSFYDESKTRTPKRHVKHLARSAMRYMPGVTSKLAWRIAANTWMTSHHISILKVAELKKRCCTIMNSEVGRNTCVEHSIPMRGYYRLNKVQLLHLLTDYIWCAYLCISHGPEGDIVDISSEKLHREKCEICMETIIKHCQMCDQCKNPVCMDCLENINECRVCMVSGQSSVRDDRCPYCRKRKSYPIFNRQFECKCSSCFDRKVALGASGSLANALQVQLTGPWAPLAISDLP